LSGKSFRTLIALFILIDILALKGGANVKASILARDAVFRAVFVTLYNLADGDFL